jgi:hypothetical protein
VFVLGLLELVEETTMIFSHDFSSLTTWFAIALICQRHPSVVVESCFWIVTELSSVELRCQAGTMGMNVELQMFIEVWNLPKSYMSNGLDKCFLETWSSGKALSTHKLHRSVACSNVQS